ncbi:MAG: Uma2 family endonuclease [Terriglobia bacterium]
MASQARPVKYTVEDYFLFPDDGKRHELIDGDHFVTPSPNTKHQRIVLNLSSILHTFVTRHHLGEVFVAPYDVILSGFDVVEPDLLFVSASRVAIVTDKNIQGAPDLAVEILSESTRRTDEVIKRKRYEQFGINEYWIIDPELETIKIYRMTDKGYVRAAELSKEANASLTTPLLPNLNIPLANIFT